MPRIPFTREGQPDTRYTIATAPERGEFDLIVEFRGEYVGRHPEQHVAEAIAQYHADTDRDGDPLIPADYPVRPLPPERVIEPLGADVVTCGHCHRSWDDAISTSMTPAPSARCAFEIFHVYPEEPATTQDPYDIEGAARFSFTEGANVPMMTLGQFRAATAYLDASTLIVVETGTNQERHVASMGLPSGDPESDESGFSAVTLFPGTPLDYRDF